MGSLALCLRLTAVSQPWAFFSLPTRAWELAAGGLVALPAAGLARLPGLAATTLGWLGLEAVVWSVTRHGPSTPFPGTAALFPVGGTAAVLAAGCAAPRLGPDLVLRCRPLQLGGRLSWSWYLLGRPQREGDRWRANMLARIPAERPSVSSSGRPATTAPSTASRSAGGPGSPGWPGWSARSGRPAPGSWSSAPPQATGRRPGLPGHPPR